MKILRNMLFLAIAIAACDAHAMNIPPKTDISATTSQMQQTNVRAEGSTDDPQQQPVSDHGRVRTESTANRQPQSRLRAREEPNDDQQQSDPETDPENKKRRTESTTNHGQTQSASRQRSRTESLKTSPNKTQLETSQSTAKEEQEERCCICFKPFDAADTVNPRITPHEVFSCNHTEFHRTCVQEWIERSRKPNCLFCCEPAIGQVLQHFINTSNVINGNHINNFDDYSDFMMVIAFLSERSALAMLTIPSVRRSVNHASNDGLTALMIAADIGSTNIVTQLLAIPGINDNQVNRDGETALTIAVNRGNINITNLLRNHNRIGLRAHARNAFEALRRFGGRFR